MNKKKTMVIDAFQMTKSRRISNVDWPEWLHKAWNVDPPDIGSVYPTKRGTGTGTISIQTLEGPSLVSFGDWIILNSRGEIYSCKPKIFEAIYGHIFLAKEMGLLDD